MCRTLGRCVVNVGFFVVTCVGEWSILGIAWSMLGLLQSMVSVHGVDVESMFVWLFAVNVGCRCVRIYVLYLVFAWSTVLNFVCA